jgi:hypothetical protein
MSVGADNVQTEKLRSKLDLKLLPTGVRAIKFLFQYLIAWQ